MGILISHNFNLTRFELKLLFKRKSYRDRLRIWEHEMRKESPHRRDFRVRERHQFKCPGQRYILQLIFLPLNVNRYTRMYVCKYGVNATTCHVL